MAATSISDEGPVLSVITKRLRSLRKKLNRIHQMEESLSQGKTLNKEQQDVLRSKSSVLVLIDELEKLRAPLSTAIEEEISLANHQEEPHHPENADSVKDLINLIYFGSLFDVKPQSDFTSLMLTRTHERGCCLTYDYVTDDAVDLLGEKDLDLLSALQGLVISRPVDSTLSHQNTLEKCVEHAKRWIAKSDEPVALGSTVTYAGLRERLNKIMASDYFTATPQMTGPGEVVAAAAVGNFGSFQVPMHESIVSVEVPVQVEESVGGQYQEMQENSTNNEEYGTVENQSGAVEDNQKDLENSSEVVSAQGEQEQLQAEGEREEEGNGNNVDLREREQQQYGHRRGQRGGGGGGGRGGRRGNGRGRGSGRGGGPYQNARGGQFYDNYYQNPNPRNVYYNRRGSGRGAAGGSGGGGNSYYSGHPSGTAQADVGVAS